MQKMLFLDYLDGSKVFSVEKLNQENNLITYLLLFRYAHLIKFTKTETGVSFGHDDYFAAVKKNLPEYEEELIQIYKEEEPIFMALVDYSKFYNDPTRKNYVFSRNLTEALAQTKIEQDTTIFTEERAFYFEMPETKDESLELQCVYGFTIQVGERFMLVVYMLVKHENRWRTVDFTLQIHEGQSLSDEFKRVMTGQLMDEIYPSSTIRYDHETIYRTIINGIIYIYNNCEDMTQMINEFASKASKLETQKKIYTSKPFVELGKNFEILRLMKEESIGVRGHFRWQPCGVGRMQVKLTYVKPHSRDLKRIID
ncbi:MAG: hypothetical protein K2Q18_06140 [Bdellovibrionales bacterium]|nr:hypothetical protein [Bdellovibrionales bacterium]